MAFASSSVMRTPIRFSAPTWNCVGCPPRDQHRLDTQQNLIFAIILPLTLTFTTMQQYISHSSILVSYEYIAYTCVLRQSVRLQGKGCCRGQKEAADFFLHPPDIFYHRAIHMCSSSEDGFSLCVMVSMTTTTTTMTATARHGTAGEHCRHTLPKYTFPLQVISCA